MLFNGSFVKVAGQLSGVAQTAVIIVDPSGATPVVAGSQVLPPANRMTTVLGMYELPGAGGTASIILVGFVSSDAPFFLSFSVGSSSIALNGGSPPAQVLTQQFQLSQYWMSKYSDRTIYSYLSLSRATFFFFFLGGGFWYFAEFLFLAFIFFVLSCIASFSVALLRLLALAVFAHSLLFVFFFYYSSLFLRTVRFPLHTRRVLLHLSLWTLCALILPPIVRSCSFPTLMLRRMCSSMICPIWAPR